ncbi:hypothetical protein F5I97DRAFT_603544 [Phlebopus sp. FC_14]|nr:hypothetical protein F5I97DRAFT_603544 [Phlebopus sp. FC_14]
MHTLSQFYQGLSPEFGLPTFKKHVFPPPSESVIAQYRCLMPHLLDAYPFTELEKLYAEASEGVEHLSWRLNGDEIEQLRSSLSSDGALLSIHDCLTAYLVVVLNCNKDVPIRTATNASSYRNVHAPFIDGDVAGNMLLNVVSDTLPVDMAGIATSIRTSIIRSRDVSYLENWISTAGDLMLSSINSGKSFFFAPHEDVITINSNAAIDWCSAHFGFPDGSRFHTAGLAKYYFRPFRSNPVKGADGIWHRRQGFVDISMGVPTELKPKILKTLADGLEPLLNLCV